MLYLYDKLLYNVYDIIHFFSPHFHMISVFEMNHTEDHFL